MGAWTWIAVLAAVVVALVGADRWLARRPEVGRPRRERDHHHGGAAGALGELITLYQPGARHLQEEQERQRHDLVIAGDADPPWDVDLDAGTARLAAPAAAGRDLALVAPGVWVATAGRWATTSTLVVANDGDCLVVDPALTAAEVLGLAAELRIRGWRAAAGFSTHPHWDHVLWAGVLGDVPRWATATAAGAADRRREALVAEAQTDAPGHDRALVGRLSALSPAGADRRDHRAGLGPPGPGSPAPVGVPWSGPTVLAVPYDGHCLGSAALVVPDRHVLVAGDVLSDVEIPLLDPEAADPLGDYRAALDLIARLVAEHGVTVLVPGHGSVALGGEIGRRLAADRAYLDALAAGHPADDARLGSAEMAQAHETNLSALAG